MGSYKQHLLGKIVQKLACTLYQNTAIAFSYLLFTPLIATNYTVTKISDTSPAEAGTLRYYILTANAASSTDTITFDPSLAGQTINLTNPLPVINKNLTITAAAANSITINGANLYQAFSASTGSVSIQNINIQNCLSRGGSGGAGTFGGGGGVGGGAGLYIHNGANVTIAGGQFASNSAVGGTGGTGSGTSAGSAGGGGGGFGSGSAGGNQSSDGGAGALNIAGGGGGGGTSGGKGGASGTGQQGGIFTTVTGSGGGGGSGGTTSYAGGQSVLTPETSEFTSGGLGFNAGGGGGGAGSVEQGITATAAGGAVGGSGLGIDKLFGGGGGGGSYASGASGGAGVGSGGGGGARAGNGGPGGQSSDGGAEGTTGGGGGGGGSATGIGGAGGFGAGGGGGFSAGGVEGFGGGAGGASATNAGGGGGAGTGGAIFVQSGGILTVQDSVSFAAAPSNNTSSGGSAGGGTSSGGSGQAYGPDLFMRSGAKVNFTNTTPMTIATNIDSDIVPNLGGGIVMNGTGVLSLTGIDSTYTSSLTINSGTVKITNDNNLGWTGDMTTPMNTVIISNGTLQTAATLTSPRPFSLTGSAQISTDPNTTATFSGLVSGAGSLTKQGTGTLALSGILNTYSGGTTITAGTLQIFGTQSIGDANSTIAIANLATLQTAPASNITLTNPFSLVSGNATFDTEGDLTLNGIVSGSGSFTKIGPNILTLGAANSYNGGTIINAGKLIGNSTSLQGNISVNNPAILQFNQTFSGTYGGQLSGNGIFQLTGGNKLQLIGNSSSFSGSTAAQSGNLNVNGSLGGNFLISPGATLSGAGTIGPGASSPTVDNFGNIRPGNSVGTLTILGDLTLESSSSVIIEISPLQTSLVDVTGIANLNGNLTVVAEPGFYGLTNTYTILNSASLNTTTFASPSPLPNFNLGVSYVNNKSVILSLASIQPFLNFPYSNKNTKSIGNNLDAVAAAEGLNIDPNLANAINALKGLSNAAINEALDQMHPAPFSAFAEIQAALGGQLLTLFHRRPVPYCTCSGSRRIWAEPYGNWLEEKNLGEEFGFHARSQGIAGGIDIEAANGWVIGIGGAWNDTHMNWDNGHGSSKIHGTYAAAYSDYSTDNFYLGFSLIGGLDHCHSSRHISFSTIDEHAKAKRDNIEIMGQLATALFFGPSMCFAFPYLNVDLLYLKEGRAKEEGAPGLNLHVNPHTAMTLRTEAGFAVQVQDVNKYNTMCISPLFGLGWAMECPLKRPRYQASFEGDDMLFQVTGWDRTWQLFTLQFGLSITYRCFSLQSSYMAEMAPIDRTPFFDQRGEIRLNLNW
jgi:autotransporter-associated beta strand protein